MEQEIDPYDRPENAFRTDGKDVCHWCYMRPQAHLWGPYGTRVCEYCDELVEQGREWEIAEEVAARMTVNGPPAMLDLEHWRAREHDLMRRWLAVRTDWEPIESPGDES